MSYELRVYYENNKIVAWKCTCGFKSNLYPVLLEHFQMHEQAGEEIEGWIINVLTKNIKDGLVVITGGV